MNAPSLSSATPTLAGRGQVSSPRGHAGAADVAPPRWNRYDALALLVLAALVALLMGPALLGRAGFPLGDFFDQFYAFDRFAASELAAGRLPLWNPYTFSGHPFLADIQSGVFYPPNLVMLLASAVTGGALPVRALYLQVALHLFLAGAFTYAFARRRLGDRWAALLAAVVFACGGYLTSYPPLQLAVLQTDVWLPLLLLLIDRSLQAVETRRGASLRGASVLPNVLVMALVWAMVLLAGHPQSAMYVGYTALAWGIYRAWRVGLGWWRGAAIVAVSALIGLLLASAQWLPGIEYARLSVRAAASYDKLAHGFPFRDLIGVILPGAVSLWSPLYVGILPLILAVYALLRSWRFYDTPFWAGLGGVALLLSFGGGLFVYPVFYWLAPGFNIFQGQERSAFLVAFALAMLAGAGLAQLLAFQNEVETQRRRDAKEEGSGFSLSGSWRLCVALFLTGAGIALAAGLWAARGPVAGDGRAELWSLAGVGAWLAAFALLALAWLRWPRQRAWWIGLAIALAAADLVRVAAPLLAGPVPPADLGYPTTLVGPLQAAGTTRVENEYRLPANYGVLKGVEDTWGASPLRTQRYADFYAAVPPERRRRLLNVGYFLTWHNDVPGMTELAKLPVVNPANGAKETSFLLQTDPGPRAWLVNDVQVVDDAEALARLADPTFDPWQTALVAPESAALLATDGERINGWSQIADVLARGEPIRLSVTPSVARTHPTYRKAAPGHVVVDVTADAPALLALSEVWYPGWQATVDGAPAPLLRAYDTLMAVPVPAGAHAVELRFDPPMVKAGLAISGLALALVVLALAWALWRRA
ncbi:MAG: YfhO family protein [Anaerolineae bacterium]